MKTHINLDLVTPQEQIAILNWFSDTWGKTSKTSWDIEWEDCGNVSVFIDVFVYDEKILSTFILKWGHNAILQQEA